MSVAQDVRNALTTEVNKVPNIGETGSNWVLWDKCDRLPAVYTLLEADEKVRAPTRSKEVTARYRLVSIIRSDTPEDDFDTLAAQVENQIEDDPTLGSLAIDAWVSGRGSFATAKSIAGQVYIRDIFVTVVYRHPRAAA